MPVIQRDYSKRAKAEPTNKKVLIGCAMVLCFVAALCAGDYANDYASGGPERRAAAYAADAPRRAQEAAIRRAQEAATRQAAAEAEAARVARAVAAFEASYIQNADPFTKCLARIAADADRDDEVTKCQRRAERLDAANSEYMRKEILRDEYRRRFGD
jgi:hypothetical protein